MYATMERSDEARHVGLSDFRLPEDAKAWGPHEAKVVKFLYRGGKTQKVRLATFMCFVQ